MRRLLEREIAQTKPLSLVDQAGANLHRTSAVLLQEVAAYLGTKGISPKQYNILRILRGAREEGLCCGDVAARLVTPDPDTTRLLDRLVARKWIRRDHDRNDRRLVRVRITASGLALVASLEKEVQTIQNRQFHRLKDSDLKKLVSLLESLREPKIDDEP
jgi:DNA-binding MarR family transcriptional regulator